MNLKKYSAFFLKNYKLIIGGILFFGFLLIIFLNSNREYTAWFGSAVGGTLGTIFSLVAAIILYITYINQRNSIRVQLFETTFFNLLKSQNELSANIQSFFFTIDIKDGYKKTRINSKGNEFFILSKIELQKLFRIFERSTYPGIYSDYDIKWRAQQEEHFFDQVETGVISPDKYNELILDLENDIKDSYTLKTYVLMSDPKIDQALWNNFKHLRTHEKIENVYNLYFNFYRFSIGHYFRHLYHIIGFVKEYQAKNNHEIKDIKKYIDFIQSQMSTLELMLLFYNAQIFPKMKKLLIDYDFLQNLAEEDLIDESHNCIESMKLKKRSELIGI